MPRHNLINRYYSHTISSNYISSDDEEETPLEKLDLEQNFLKNVLEKTTIIKLQVKELKNKLLLYKIMENKQLIKTSSTEQLVCYYNSILTTFNEHCEKISSLKDMIDLIRSEIIDRNGVSEPV